MAVKQQITHTSHSRITSLSSANIGGVLVVLLVVFALDQWAKQDPAPFCNANLCAETADTLRIMEMEGY